MPSKQANATTNETTLPMKTRESGMPPEEMWGGFFDAPCVLTKLGLTSNCRDVVEFGCGYGTFTIPAAQIIQGTIHALDIDPQMIEETNSKVSSSKVSNVNLMLQDFVTDGTGMPDVSVDYVMMFNILHAVERDAMLREAWRILASNGTLAVMHWNFDPSTPRGPSMDIRPRPSECKSWVENSGFQMIGNDLIDLPPFHYGFVFKKSC